MATSLVQEKLHCFSLLAMHRCGERKSDDADCHVTRGGGGGGLCLGPSAVTKLPGTSVQLSRVASRTPPTAVWAVKGIQGGAREF